MWWIIIIIVAVIVLAKWSEAKTKREGARNAARKFLDENRSNEDDGIDD